MAGLFENNKNNISEVPEWAGFFSLKEFKDFIALIEHFFKGQYFNIDIENAVATATDFGETRLGLMNLAEVCHTAPINEWKDVIDHHFNRMLEADKDGKKFGERIRDFSEISEYLALRIWPKEYLEGIEPVYREDIEDLISTLVLDLPTAVQNIKIDDAKRWNRLFDDVFQIAIKNVLEKYPVQIDNTTINDQPCYVLSGEHFFVSTHALVLERYPRCIGKYGTIVSFPHRHIVICYPINGEDVIKSLSNLMFVTSKMYQEGPGSISPNIYWYVAGTFTKLPYEFKDNNISFYPPESFTNLLEQLVK